MFLFPVFLALPCLLHPENQATYTNTIPEMPVSIALPKFNHLNCTVYNMLINSQIFFIGRMTETEGKQF